MKYKIVFLLSVILSVFTYGNTNYMPGYPDYSPKEIQQTDISTGNVYPDVNSSGFVEMKVSGRDYTNDLDKLDTIRQDEYYKKIPNDIMKGTPKYENRYNVELEGNLDEETEVKYSIQKEPDFPGIYNVYIKNKLELQFGDFNTKYANGEYINLEKYMNGVETRTIDKNWKGKATIGKEKSEPENMKRLETIQKYKVGKSFLEGSVIVYLKNNQKLSENKDYTVNYYDGSVIFNNRRITKIDYIKIIYEFTNPIQDFIPALSRKNFTGASYTYNPSQNIMIDELEVVSHNETIIIKDQSDVLSNRVNLAKTPIKLGSESVYLNSKLLTRGVHYFVKNNTGLLRFVSKQLAFDDTLTVNYQYLNSKNEKELLLGNGSPGPYYLKQKYIIPDTLSVKLGGIEAREFVDYVYKKIATVSYFTTMYTKIKPLKFHINTNYLKKKMSNSKTHHFLCL